MDERQGELHPHPVAADEVVPLADDDIHGVVVVKVDEPELSVEGSLVKFGEYEFPFGQIFPALSHIIDQICANPGQIRFQILNLTIESIPVWVVLPVRDADGPRDEAELAEVLHKLRVADAVLEPADEDGLGLVAELDAGPRQLHPDPLALDEVLSHVHYLPDDAVPE